MNGPLLLEKALDIATQAHHGQKDRSGYPYIFHPIRMMTRLPTDTEKIVALLHDVVEDSPWTLNDLQNAGFPPIITTAIDALTHRPNESYENFLHRTSQNPTATRVKLADLEDNMNLCHHHLATPNDLARFQKYQNAWNHLARGTMSPP